MGLEAAAVLGGASIISGVMGADAAGDAAQMQSDQNYLATQEQRRQYDQTRQDLLPFLQAATGQGGALNQLMAGINQAPGVPNLPGAYTNVPQLEQFSFDPRAALDNPALQFQLEMGQQQMDRIAGKNRLLGSGQRLIEAQRFGQGLASQSIGDEFQRQLAANQQRNALTGQQYGLNVGANESQTNRLLQQYGLQSNDYNQRLNRLAGIVDVGRGTGTAMGGMGLQTAGNIGNLMQNTGQAQAQGRIGQANAYGNMLQQGAMLYGMGAFNSPTVRTDYSIPMTSRSW